MLDAQQLVSVFGQASDSKCSLGPCRSHAPSANGNDCLVLRRHLSLLYTLVNPATPRPSSTEGLRRGRPTLAPLSPSASQWRLLCSHPFL